MQLLKIKPTEAMARGRRSATEDEMNEIKMNLEQLQDKVGERVSQLSKHVFVCLIFIL